MPLVQNSLIHPPHPNTPIPTPSDLHTDLINTPTDPPTHTTIMTTLPSPTQTECLPSKEAFFFSKTHPVQFTLSMHLNRH